MDTSRRRFFNDYFLKNTIHLIAEIHGAYEEGKKAYEETKSDLNYFDSFESAYPLISESSYFLEDEAARLGIDPKDMTELEIVKKIYFTDKKKRP